MYEESAPVPTKTRLQGIELPTLLVVLQQMELSCMEGLSSYWELIFTSRNGGLNRRDQYIKEMIPSRELTYPPDKAYLKMIFLSPGGIC